MAEPPSRTSTSPCLENRWSTVSRSSIETIGLGTRHISGRRGLDLSFLKSGLSRSGNRAERNKE